MYISAKVYDSRAIAQAFFYYYYFIFIGGVGLSP
jgi:hypothetical protein